MNNHKKEPNYLESQNRVLFVGNGINDAQKINWNAMLFYVQDRLFEDKSIDSEKISNLDGTSPTLFFESLCKSSSNPEETEKKLRDFVKDYVNDKSNFVHKLWDLYNVIITTNFDNNLILSNSNIFENDTNEKKLVHEKSVLYRRFDFIFENQKKALFFPHGYFKNPGTICLGYEQYIKNLRRIEDFLNTYYPENNTKKNKKQSTSWIDYFVNDNKTIDILGFSLCDEEIDIWKVINHRKKILEKIKNNTINYYDLSIDRLDDKNQKERLETKHKILKLFGINVIAIKDAKEYNSDFYSLCLKEIKEDMEKNLRIQKTDKSKKQNE